MHTAFSVVTIVLLAVAVIVDRWLMVQRTRTDAVAASQQLATV
jgi:hypothetical protein